jgi:hypothetical protein
MDEDDATRKKTAASRGSAKVTSGGHTAPKIKRHRSSLISDSDSDDSNVGFSKSKAPLPAPLPTQNEVFTFLNTKKRCCSKGTDSHCCLETYFLNESDDGINLNASYAADESPTVDTTKLYKFILALRKITRTKNKNEMDEHTLSEVRQCIKGTKERKTSTTLVASENVVFNTNLQFVYEWSLGLLTPQAGVALEGPFIVCREVFAFAWGISIRQIKNAAETIRESEYGYCRSSKVRPLTDESRYFEEFSYDDVETVMRENVLVDNELGTSNVGE